MNAVPILSWSLVLSLVISVLALVYLLIKNSTPEFAPKRKMLLVLVAVQIFAVAAVIYSSEFFLPKLLIDEAANTANMPSQQIESEVIPERPERRTLRAEAYAVSEGHASSMAIVEIPSGWKYLYHDVQLRSTNHKVSRDVQLVKDSKGEIRLVELRLRAGSRALFEPKSWISASLIVEIERVPSEGA
ncbi:MAG: hypothetical protein ABW170_19415 [Candidatus Thiodiazotropha sp. L084R]